MPYSEITIGEDATNRSSTVGSLTSHITVDKTASGSGILNVFEFYFASNAGGVYVGTVYNVSTKTPDTRDYENIGSVSSGSKQTFTGKNCSVESGDSICVYFSSGTLDATNGGGSRKYNTGNILTGAPTGVWATDTYETSDYGTGMSVPDAPTSVSATDNLNTKVTVSWTAGTGETGGHRVYRDGVDISGVVNHGTNYYDDTTAVAGTTYAYTVKAINDAGLSAASSADDGTRIASLSIHQSECVGALGNLS